MLDRAVLSVLGLFAGVLASTVTPARGQNEGQRYFRNAGWTVESLVAAVLIWTIASGIERADAQTNTSLFFQGHNWKVEAVFSDGQRSVCVATTRSLDGGTFALTATIDREWRAIFRPGEGFEPKRKRTMTMFVDGTKVARAESIVAQDGYASGGLLNGMALGQVRNGQALEVETVLGRSEISLTGSAEAVLQIEKCLGQLTQFAAQSPDGVAQRRVPTQSIGPQGMPQGAIGQFPGRMVDPPRPPTAAEMEAYGARRQGAPLPAPSPQQQQAAPQPTTQPVREGYSPDEMVILRRMLASPDAGTRAAGRQLMQKFGPRSEEEKADLEYKRALTEYIRRRIAEHTPPPARTPTHYSGTGIVVSRTGKVLTNAHVVRECSSIRVALAGRHSSEATVARRDDDNDLALLDTSLPPVDAPRFKLNVRTGEAVSVYGFPFADDLPSSGTFTQGIVSATAGLRDDARLFQLTAPVHPGNSGGPVLDAAGNVIGVIVLKFIKGENTSYAIKSSIAARFIEANGVKVEQRPSGAPSRSAPDLADSAKSFTVFIICQKKAS